MKNSEITREQVAQIASNISKIFRDARPNLLELDKIVDDDDYSKGRNKQPITKLIYAAFKPEHTVIAGAQIKKVYYGKNFCLPEITINENIFHIYNKTAKPYETIEVTSNVEEFGKRFHLIEVTITEHIYELEKLEIVFFNGVNEKGRARIAKRKVIWSSESSGCI